MCWSRIPGNIILLDRRMRYKKYNSSKRNYCFLPLLSSVNIILFNDTINNTQILLCQDTFAHFEHQFLISKWLINYWPRLATNLGCKIIYFFKNTQSHFLLIKPQCWWSWDLNLQKSVRASETGKRFREFSWTNTPLNSVLTFSAHTVECLYWSTCLTSFLPL